MKYIVQAQFVGGGIMEFFIEAMSKHAAMKLATRRMQVYEPSSKVKRIVVRETVPSVGGKV